MALSHISSPSLHLPTPNFSSHSLQPPPLLHLRRPILSPLSLSIKTLPKIRATENGAQTDNDADQTTGSTSDGAGDDISEIGAEIKKAMEEREKESYDGTGDFFGGVSQEIGKIEWPEFRKVVGITGVVLGVIAGSSVVLLTVNAVLAELSDQVFAGKGVQDFFGS